MRRCLGLQSHLIVCLGLLIPTTVRSADLDYGIPPDLPLVPSAAPAWSLQILPYAWLPFLVGDITVRGRPVHLDIDPIQVVDHLTHSGGRIPAWMSYIEARRGPISIYNDSFYANLGLSGDLARTRPRADIGVSAGLDFQQAVIELSAGYEVASWAPVPDREVAIDLIAGARYWYQEADLNLALSTELDVAGLEVRGNRALARSGTVDWFDPLVGARLRHQFAPGYELTVKGDVGGFGAGSKLSWQAFAALTFDLATHDGVTYAGMVGYRALDVDYEQGSGRRKYAYDILQHGPVLGLAIGF